MSLFEEIKRRKVFRVAAAYAATHDRSVAVLPFADFSPDAGQEWCSNGLTEEILNALARPAGGALR